jgi:hypothetical protein
LISTTTRTPGALPSSTPPHSTRAIQAPVAPARCSKPGRRHARWIRRSMLALQKMHCSLHRMPYQLLSMAVHPSGCWAGPAAASLPARNEAGPAARAARSRPCPRSLQRRLSPPNSLAPASRGLLPGGECAPALAKSPVERRAPGLLLLPYS